MGTHPGSVNMPPARGIRLSTVLVALVRASVKHPLLVLSATTVFTVASVFAAYDLKLNYDLKSLLPDDYASVTRLEDLSARIGAQSDLIVEIRSPDPDANKRFGAAIATFLESREHMRFVIFKRDKQILEKSALLFLSTDKLEDLRGRVKERIAREVRKQLSLDGASDDAEEGGDAAEDEEDEEDLDPFDRDERAVGRADAQGDGGAPAGEGGQAWSDEDLVLDKEKIKARFEEVDIPEYFTADEGRLLAVKARPSFLTTDVKQTRALIDDVRAEITRLDPQRYHPDMEVGLEGHYADMTGQVNTMKDDVVGSTAVSFGALLLCSVAYFRRGRPLLYIFLPLSVAMAGALGVAWIFFGGLNLVSAFILAILLGLGIDFGVHMIARYREELAAGAPWHEAYVQTAATTGVSVVTGATTTSIVFFLLLLAHFKGFSQFGVVAGFGVLFSLLAVFTVTPAILALIEPHFPWNPRYRHHKVGALRARPAFVRALVGVVVVVASGTALWSLVHVPDLAFEYDFSKLGTRPKPQAQAAQAAARITFRDAVGRVTTGAPTVVMADDPADIERLHRDLAYIAEAPAQTRLDMKHARDADDIADPRIQELVPRFGIERIQIIGEYLTKAFSLYSFVPERQDEKLEILADIDRRLKQKRNLFKGKDRDDLDEFLEYVETKRLTRDDLPAWIRAQFREIDGREGTFLILWTRGSKDSYETASLLKKGLFDLPLADGRTLPSAANCYTLADVMDFGIYQQLGHRDDGKLLKSDKF